MWNEIITLIYLEPNEMLTILLFKSSFTHWKSNTLSVITKILLMEAKYINILHFSWQEMSKNLTQIFVINATEIRFVTSHTSHKRKSHIYSHTDHRQWV